MKEAIKTKMSVEEYFNFEEQSEIRHEFYKGEILAFAGASTNHNRIIQNLSDIFRRNKKTGCEGFISDLKVWLRSYELFTYPDFLLICGKID